MVVKSTSSVVVADHGAITIDHHGQRKWNLRKETTRVCLVIVNVRSQIRTMHFTTKTLKAIPTEYVMGLVYCIQIV